MSRYNGFDYGRGPPRDRSRSPSRFSADRRQSSIGAFENRAPGPPHRGPASDAPRGPRPPGGPNTAPRVLREAPPLSGGDRGRPFRDRDYDRRPSPPPPLLPRNRSPPRNIRDARDFPPRDLDTTRARRGSRDGPLSAGSNFSENSPFTPTARGGGFGRGRGRGDFDYRPGRGGRRMPIDDRDREPMFRDRSPPGRFARDLSRDSRDADRRDERPRFAERRDEDRRGGEWSDRERDLDRMRREPPPPPLVTRLEPRASNESLTGASAAFSPAPAAPPINPERLAIIESTTGTDTAARRPSTIQATPPARDARRDPPSSETPAYLNGRAETIANRYGSRGSSPPTQAPPVPAFSFAMPSAAPPPTPSQPSKLQMEIKPSPAESETSTPAEPKPPVSSLEKTPVETRKPFAEDKPTRQGSEAPHPERSERPPSSPEKPARSEHPAESERPTVQEGADSLPRHDTLEKGPTQDRSGPPANAPAAPRAERSHSSDYSMPPRLHGVKSMESLARNAPPPSSEGPSAYLGSMPPSPTAARQPLPHPSKSISPHLQQPARFADPAIPTGPKATRSLPVQGPDSPRIPFTSPRLEGMAHGHGGSQPAHSPPPTAPLGPRRQSFSVSPKITHSSIPNAPKGPRGALPIAPRAIDRGPPTQNRPTMPAFAPPSGPRNLQWNQWRRPPPSYGSEKLGPGIPAKRDANGDEKERQPSRPSTSTDNDAQIKSEDRDAGRSELGRPHDDAMDVDETSPRRASAGQEGHSAAQSFFGKTVEKGYDEVDTSSEEDELDEEEDATLLEAKHARAERELRSQKADLSESRYRATTPLGSIARLARISVKDLERIAEREQEMDVDEQPASTDKPAAPPTGHSSESSEGAGALTPHGDNLPGGANNIDEDTKEPKRRLRRPTPEPIELPFMIKGEEAVPLQELDVFHDNIKTLVERDADIMAELTHDVRAEDDAQYEAEEEFRRLYRKWKDECRELERAQEAQENLERQQSIEPTSERDLSLPPSATAPIEGRRVLKFSSEYEMELVLKQSEETARIEQEKLEREAMKVQADMLKEAVIPDQKLVEMCNRDHLIDANRLRHPDDLTVVFSYEPPADNFSENEQNIFIAAFKDTPKKWGEIASLLPGRTYKDCIHHYYTNKWDGRFRDNRAKKFKGGRRGRGGKPRVSRGSALMADLNRTEDGSTPVAESGTGRPRRAAAPTTFADKELESKLALTGPSPSKKTASSKNDGNGDAGAEKVTKKRRTGEKPGRKAKTPHLAALAAAPALAPPVPQNQPPAPVMPTKEEVLHAQNLEAANLLAGLHSGHTAAMMHPEGQRMMLNHQEPFPIHMAAAVDEPVRIKAGPEAAAAAASAASSKSGANSYWSVPEQTDFKRYIAHFGTDFNAIATHMGTKTQVMIKNHYQRQVDGGGNDELRRLASEADARKERGESIGAPPTPTPIVKRKYENPRTALPPQERTPRSNANNPDAMDLDDHNPSSGAHPPASAAAVGKHASSPQFTGNKPRYATPAQSTPVQAHRIVPSPLGTASTPATTMSSTPPTLSHTRPYPQSQQSLGSGGMHIKPDPRPNLQPTVGFRLAKQEPAPPPTSAAVAPLSVVPPPLAVAGHGALHSPTTHAPPPQHLHRRDIPNANDPGFLQALAEEREKAIRLYEQQKQPPAPSASQASQPPLSASQQLQQQQQQVPPVAVQARHSPANRPHHSPPVHDRRMLFDDRQAPGSPPRMFQTPLQPQSATPAPSHPWMSQQQQASSYPAPPVSSSASASLASRAPLGEQSLGRIDPVGLAQAPPPQAQQKIVPPPAPTPAPGPPKRSNLSSILNSDPEPAPRVSVMRDSALPPTRPASPATTGRYPGAYGSRTVEPSRREPYGQPPPPPATSSHMHRPQFSQSAAPLPHDAPPSAHERDVRPSYLHRGALGNLAQGSRGNPSPPPYGHSRTPSLTTGPSAPPPPRDHRSLLGQQPGQAPPPASAHGTPQPIHATPYGMSQAAPPPPFSQAPMQEHSRAHHVHESMHSRERYYGGPPPQQLAPQERPEDPYRSRMAPMDQRERDSYYGSHHRQDVAPPPSREPHHPADAERHYAEAHLRHPADAASQQHLRHQPQDPHSQQRQQQQQHEQQQHRQLEQQQQQQHRHMDLHRQQQHDHQQRQQHQQLEQHRHQEVDRRRQQQHQESLDHRQPQHAYSTRGPPSHHQQQQQQPPSHGSPYHTSSYTNPPPASNPPPPNASTSSAGGGGGLRAEAMRESQIAMHEAERRLQQQRQHAASVQQQHHAHAHHPSSDLRDLRDVRDRVARGEDPDRGAAGPLYGRNTPSSAAYAGYPAPPPPQQGSGPPPQGGAAGERRDAGPPAGGRGDGGGSRR